MKKQIKIQEITCNKCLMQFRSFKAVKDIHCPKCNSNESLSIR